MSDFEKQMDKFIAAQKGLPEDVMAITIITKDDGTIGHLMSKEPNHQLSYLIADILSSAVEGGPKMVKDILLMNFVSSSIALGETYKEMSEALTGAVSKVEHILLELKNKESAEAPTLKVVKDDEIPDEIPYKETIH